MADSWIKVEYGTLDKIEVARIATALGTDQYAVVGRMVKLWSYFDLHSREGFIAGVDAAFLDRLVGQTGFAAATIAAGWMQANGDGVTLPNFDRHNGGGAKARALNTRRQSKFQNAKSKEPERYKSNAPPNAEPLQSALPEEGRKEERREENTPQPPEGGIDQGVLPFSQPDPQLCAPLDTPAFASVWADWLRYRRERRITTRPQTLTAQLKKLAGLGEAVAIATIERSILNGWNGLFPEGGKGNAADPYAGFRDAFDAAK